jgi:hypothetical protein
MNGADVTVNINSPAATCSKDWQFITFSANTRPVTVKVLGIAASAASIIAMAGDDIQIGRGAFLMIHNCWVYAMGNRHDFAELATSLEPFDTAMADIYAARSGLDIAPFRNLWTLKVISVAVMLWRRDWQTVCFLLMRSATAMNPRSCAANLMHCWRKQIPPV